MIYQFKVMYINVFDFSELGKSDAEMTYHRTLDDAVRGACREDRDGLLTLRSEYRHTAVVNLDYFEEESKIDISEEVHDYCRRGNDEADREAKEWANHVHSEIARVRT